MRRKMLMAAISLAGLCLFAPTMTAKAETGINTYTVEGSYTVNIPAEVNIKEATNKGTLSMTGELDACYNLEIKISSNTNYYLLNTDNSKWQLQYKLSEENVVFSKEEDSADKVISRYDVGIRVQDTPIVSGEYTDILTFTMNAKSYAQEATKYKLLFDTNCSGDSSVIISTGEKFVNENEAYGVLPIPKRDGYAFDGWYTAASAGEEVTSETIMNSSGDITVYAHWNPHKLTINYHNDGAEYINWNNERVPVEKDGVTRIQEEYYGQTFSNKTDGLYDSWRWDYRPGYTIKRDCWKIGKDGTKEYKDKETGDTTTIEYAEYLDVLEELKEGDVTIELYPIWIANTYTVKYDSNCKDATGSMTSSNHTYDVEQKLTKNNFIRAGYEFVGWSTSKDGDVIYPDEQTVLNLTATSNGTVTLYAKWKQVSSNSTQSDTDDVNGENSITQTETSEKQEMNVGEDALDSESGDSSGNTDKAIISDEVENQVDVEALQEGTLESEQETGVMPEENTASEKQ